MVEEGTTITLDASGTTDPDQDPASLTYLWDLNGNGVFGETGSAATNGDEVGVHPVFSAAGLPGGTHPDGQPRSDRCDWAEESRHEHDYHR